ncbi:amino acid permease [Planosporangium mesophilum]|uniref:Amino acid permease n=1 Tax=Planosporangium mesophilum TaxID=689768 RepID=A0A8J3X050_9ACTN|nr:amino acid permease [Planosporangium mesophilum]NJC86136.1 amino acid permease [Planosporangium mesophilum]GII23015.1 amino acid permease [Planosporangium mesophilum]
MSIFRTKPVEQSIRETDDPERKLRRDLSAVDLAAFGIGVIVGTGIFVLTGQQAAINAGPAIVISFVIAGIVCALAAMCYAEFASTVPVAGSAYTFAYATLGEFIAWIIGWDLCLELALGASVVSRGWSAYLQRLFDLPTWLAGDKAIPDWGAIGIVALLGIVMIVGVKVSSRLTNILVAVKLAVVLFVIGLGVFFIKAANYHPFIPPARPAEKVSGGEEPLLQVIAGVTPQHFGWFGILAAAAIVFFAYIGFDVVATTAEETRNPQRDMPRGIIGSLAVCALLYVAVSAVVTGMTKYTNLNTGAPLARAFDEVGQGWAANLISLGAICGITTVILVLMLGQTRVFFAMSRDGLLPPVVGKVHPRFGTPWVITIITCAVVAALAGFIPLSELSELTSIGTLFAFVVVSIGVVVLRRTRPDLPRAFRAPGVPWLPALSVAASVWLMLNLPVQTWIRFVVWMAVGLVIYFLYSRRSSRLRHTRETPEPVTSSS